MEYFSSPQFIDLLNQFISIWTQRYLSYTLNYNPMLLYFVVQIVPALPLRSSFSGSCVLWCTPNIVGFFFFNTYFLALQRCSSFIEFLLKSLNQPFLQRSSDSFYWIMIKKARSGHLGGLIITGILLPGLLSW